MERTFVIFNVSEVNLIDFTEVLETSADTLRLSVDGTKTFVKWDGVSVPVCVESLTTKSPYYSYEEMLAILSTEEWVNSSMIP
jgi:hypothetical protein